MLPVYPALHEQLEARALAGAELDLSGQAVQAVALAVAAYFPATHSKQKDALEAFEKDPAEQLRHGDEPLTALNCPAGHALQRPCTLV